MSEIKIMGREQVLNFFKFMHPMTVFQSIRSWKSSSENLTGVSSFSPFKYLVRSQYSLKWRVLYKVNLYLLCKVGTSEPIWLKCRSKIGSRVQSVKNKQEQANTVITIGIQLRSYKDIHLSLGLIFIIIYSLCTFCLRKALYGFIIMQRCLRRPLIQQH